MKFNLSKVVDGRYVEFVFNTKYYIYVIYDSFTKDYGFWWLNDDNDETYFKTQDVKFSFFDYEEDSDVLALSEKCKPGKSNEIYNTYVSTIQPWIEKNKENFIKKAERDLAEELL